MGVKITDARRRRTSLADREKRDRELAAEQTRLRQEHQARNAAAVKEQQRVAALSPEERAAEREQAEADRKRRHVEANTAALTAAEEKAAKGPAENKAIYPPFENKAPEIDATDAARKLAEDEGLDLGAVTGTGVGGRITVDDVRGALS